MADTDVSFEVIAGSYEEYLLGYMFVADTSKMSQSFAARDHTSSIRNVTTAGTYLASGGADDRIILYDMKMRKEYCMLTHHTGTVNCLAFVNNTHLLSGGADGILSIVRIGNWQVEKLWPKAHKGLPILDIAVHDSGKLALTLGADYTLRTWNLVKGRQAYAINLLTKSKNAKSFDHITWAPCGIQFALSGGICTQIWSIETGGMLTSIEHSNKVICSKWLSKKKLLVGYENGQFGKVNISKGEVKINDAHSSRVKALALYKNYVVSASSCGEIKVWTKNLHEVAKCETGCRLTCLCIVCPLKEKSEESNEDTNKLKFALNEYTDDKSDTTCENVKEPKMKKKLNKKLKT